jgi:creatinine amidohydrolase
MLKYWDQLNQNEVKAILETGVFAMVVSSLEQHALHLPTGTDRFIGEAIVRDVAFKSRHTIVTLPTVSVGFSYHHMKFSGSVTLEQGTLIRVITDIMNSLEINGCKNVILFNSHGGNTPSIKVAVNEVGRKFSGNLMLIEYWDFLRPYIGQIRKTALGGIGHAGEMETSLMMHLHPELVRMPPGNPYALAKEYKGTNPDMFAGNKVYMYRDFSSISPYGNVGIPYDSSAEQGKLILETVTDEIAAYLDMYV